MADALQQVALWELLLLFVSTVHTVLYHIAQYGTTVALELLRIHCYCYRPRIITAITTTTKVLFVIENCYYLLWLSGMTVHEGIH
jgi:hypothetical protein